MQPTYAAAPGASFGAPHSPLPDLAAASPIIRPSIRRAFDCIPYPVLIADQSSALLHANQAAIDLLGCPLETLQALRLEDLVLDGTGPPADAPDRWQGRVRLKCRDSSVVAAEAVASRMESERGPWTVLVLRDLTVQDQMASDLLAANDNLDTLVDERTRDVEEANRELEAFAYSISHDLQAPLRSMYSFAGILVHDFPDQLPAEALRCAQFIRASAQRMNLLVEDLLHFSRLSRQELRKQVIDPTQVASQVLETLLAGAPGRPVRAKVGELPMCEADPALLAQVFVNLLSNALKYTRRRDPAIIEVGWRKGDAGENVYFVRDNGVGFDMTYAHKLFEVFQRLHSSEEYEGTGAGLSIVRRIVTRHGGRVWAESSPEHGATFSFTLG